MPSNSKEYRKLWLYCNIAFIINYTLKTFSFLVTVPIPVFPNFFNSICLILIYSILVFDLIVNYRNKNITLQHVYGNQNLFCLAFFFFFVPYILLLPFYLLCIFHVNNSVLLEKKIHENRFYYEFCVSLGKYSSLLGRASLFLEVCLIPVALVMTLMRKFGVVPFILYLVIIRQQYMTNNNMKSVINELIQTLEAGMTKYMPKKVLDCYLKAKPLIGRYCGCENTAKKMQ